MSDHQFERQVQQKMDELKLRPSDTVWQGVEQELDKDKRRRRSLWWVPALLLICGAGGMIVFQNTKSYVGNEVAKVSETQSQPKADAKVATRSQHEQASPQKSEPVNEGDAKTNQAATQDVNAETNQTAKQSDQTTLHENSVSPIGIAENQNRRFSRRVPSANTSKKYGQKPVKENQKVLADALVGAEGVDLVGKELPNNLANTATAQPESPYKKFNKSTSTASLQLSPLPTVQKSESLWGFGLHAYGGVSNLNQGDEVDYTTSAQMAPSFSGSLLPANGLMYKPSAIKKGPAFTIGAFAQRKISKRLSLTIGLDYSEFSTYTEVGTPTNMFSNQRSMLYLNTFNSPGTTENYHARYQFLELPVTAQYQLNKSEKFPIYANAGMAVSRLLNTNALHYDSFTGAYYSDNSLFNRTHFMIAGGVGIGVLNKTHLPLTIGPVFKYQVSNLVKKDASEGKHLLSAGLSVRMTWKR